MTWVQDDRGRSRNACDFTKALGGTTFTQWLGASSSSSRPASACSQHLRLQRVRSCGELAAAPQRLDCELQPPLTLPLRSQADPCIDALPLLCVNRATIMSSSAGCLSAMHRSSQTPETRTRCTSSRGARGQTATRAPKCLISPDASLSIARTLLKPLENTGELCVGWRLSVQARISTKLCSPRSKCLAQQLAAVGG